MVGSQSPVRLTWLRAAALLAFACASALAGELSAPELPKLDLPAVSAQAPLPSARLEDILEERANIPALPEASASASQGQPAVPKAAMPAQAGMAGASRPATPSGAATPEAERSSASVLFDKASDQIHYTRHLAREFWWYSVTHIGDPADRRMWPTYSSRAAAAPKGALPVSRHRALFSHLRVMGGSGRFYVLGPASRDDQAVLAEGRKTFSEYFTSPSVGPREKASFEAFLQRVTGYNAERRNRTNLRKHVRDALLEASVTPVAKLAALFDRLLPPGKDEEARRFQAERQDAVLADFRKALLDTISEEPAGARDRVVAAVLLGSFAQGGATPSSDFDTELLTKDGSSGRVAEFDRRFSARWKALGYSHPVTIKEVAGPASRGFLDKIYWTQHVVITPSPELEARLQRKAGEPAPFLPESRLTARGRVGRLVQRAAVHLATIYSDLRR